MTPIKVYVKLALALLFCLMFLAGGGIFVGSCVTHGSRSEKAIGIVLMAAALLGVWGIEKDDED